MTNSAVVSCKFNGVPVVSIHVPLLSVFESLYCAFRVSVNAFTSQQSQFNSCKISQKEKKNGQKYLNITLNSTCHSPQWLECEI